MYEVEENLDGLGVDPVSAGVGVTSILSPLIGKIFGGDEEDAIKKQQELIIKQQREATVANAISAEKTKRTVFTGLIIGGAILASALLLYGATKK